MYEIELVELIYKNNASITNQRPIKILSENKQKKKTSFDFQTHKFPFTVQLRVETDQVMESVDQIEVKQMNFVQTNIKKLQIKRFLICF